VLNVKADNAFKRRETTVKPFQESSALIDDGVFAISRNPMYLGMALIIAGVATLFGSATPWLVAVALAVFFDRFYIAAEEAMMARTFGESYATYSSRVRRWI